MRRHGSLCHSRRQTNSALNGGTQICDPKMDPPPFVILSCGAVFEARKWTHFPGPRLRFFSNPVSKFSKLDNTKKCAHSVRVLSCVPGSKVAGNHRRSCTPCKGNLPHYTTIARKFCHQGASASLTEWWGKSGYVHQDHLP